MMTFPDDENGDVLRRMQQHGFDFTKPHAIEFFAVYATEKDADIVARQYLADHKTGDRLENRMVLSVWSLLSAGGRQLSLLRWMKLL